MILLFIVIIIIFLCYWTNFVEEPMGEIVVCCLTPIVPVVIYMMCVGIYPVW